MNKKLPAILVAAVAALAPLAPLTPASGATAAARPASAAIRPGSAATRPCASTFTLAPKHATRMVQSRVLRVRAGRHACFDRLVIDIGRGRQPGYRVRYVRRIISDPSGMVLHVRGDARLLITIQAPAGPGYHPNARNLADVSHFRTFRQVRGAGSFEGITSIGLGVRAKLPFRVFRVDNGTQPGSRLVIDVAHQAHHG
jgi:hypothetical protein